MQLGLLKKITGGITCICMLIMMCIAPTFAADEFSSVSGDITILKMIEPGQKAIDFTVKTLDDEDYKLSDAMGKKVVFLLFWSIFCQPCLEEVPVIKEMHEKIGKDKIEVLAVSLDGDRRVGSIEKFIEKNKLEFTFLMDVFNDDSSGFVASELYGVSGTPTYYIIGKDGVVVSNHVGKSTLDELIKKINDAKP